MNIRVKLLYSVGIAHLFLFCLTNCYASDWPPVLDEHNPIARTLDGRTVQRYTHGVRAQWGYPRDSQWSYPPPMESGAAQQNRNSFYVVWPSKPQDNAPLYVVLHSANRTAYDYFGYASLNRKVDGDDDPHSVVTNVPDGFYGLYLNTTNPEWWGWSQARENMRHQIEGRIPAELRVLDTVEWVVEHYRINRNRIYLTGVSMGGAGALAIGMAHGDVFAAVRVTVPAGTGYASYLTAGFPSNPDPPVVVDLASPLDHWSITEPALVTAALARRLPLVLIWGPFGHTAFGSVIAQTPVCKAGLQFPWLDIRNSQAYPVFTRATSDQQSPWLNAPADFDDSGQMNAYFRWKDLIDTPEEFSIRIWLAQLDIPELTEPSSSIADVTLRRLQRFHVQADSRYAWKLTKDAHVVARGTITPGAGTLLTIPDLKLTSEAEELSVTLKTQ